MARAGRKRKEAERYPNGTVYRHDPAILQRTMEKRAEMVGWDNARNPKAGYLIGQMELTGRVAPEQYFAACRAGYFWGMNEKILGMYLDAPRRNISCVQFYGVSIGRSCNEIDEDLQVEIRNAVSDIDGVIKKNIRAWLFAKTLLDEIIMESDLPPSMDPKMKHPLFSAHWEIFRNSLDVLVDFWGLKNKG